MKRENKLYEAKAIVLVQDPIRNINALKLSKQDMKALQYSIDRMILAQAGLEATIQYLIESREIRKGAK